LKNYANTENIQGESDINAIYVQFGYKYKKIRNREKDCHYIRINCHIIDFF